MPTFTNHKLVWSCLIIFIIFVILIFVNGNSKAIQISLLIDDLFIWSISAMDVVVAIRVIIVILIAWIVRLHLAVEDVMGFLNLAQNYTSLSNSLGLHTYLFLRLPFQKYDRYQVDYQALKSITTYYYFKQFNSYSKHTYPFSSFFSSSSIFPRHTSSIFAFKFSLKFP